jgi:hypothetical protein
VPEYVAEVAPQVSLAMVWLFLPPLPQFASAQTDWGKETQALVANSAAKACARRTARDFPPDFPCPVTVSATATT